MLSSCEKMGNFVDKCGPEIEISVIRRLARRTSSILYLSPIGSSHICVAIGNCTCRYVMGMSWYKNHWKYLMGYQFSFQDIFPRPIISINYSRAGNLYNILPSLLIITAINTVHHSGLCCILHTSNVSFIGARDTASSSMVVCILIFYQELSMLSVSSRLVTCNLDDVKPGSPATICLAEDVVNFLQGTVSCFWIKEVNHWKNEGVYDGKDYVGLVTD
jgi:hypothetical protein